MGFIDAAEIDGAVAFLLPILQAERSVLYSRFYDGTEETQAEVTRAINPGNSLISVELLIDLAVDPLVEHGVVRQVMLDTRLTDGEPDYRIELIEGQPKGPIHARHLDL